MTSQSLPSGGPRRLDPQGIDRFLAKTRWGALCGVDSAGELLAIPAMVSPDAGGRLVLESPQPETTGGLAARGASVCVVVDEFETYEGIEGVILKGRIGPGRIFGETLMEVASRVGFTFAGTLPPTFK